MTKTASITALSMLMLAAAPSGALVPAAAAAPREAVNTPRSHEIAYGTDPLQRLDFYPATKAVGRNAPLVLFVHGGGWKRGAKEMAAYTPAAAHYTGSGYAFASIDYRLVPAATVEQQAEDVALALKALLDRADALGIDRHRVVIMGHSAGAHLVALVGTDEQYLKRAGLSFADLDGVIANDGAAYDIPVQMRTARIMRATYEQAFGTNPGRQRALSPTQHAAAPNAHAFLLIHVQRRDGVAQARALEAALAQAGTRVARHEFPGTGRSGHGEIFRRLGDPEYPATRVVDTWLAGVFAR